MIIRNWYCQTESAAAIWLLGAKERGSSQCNKNVKLQSLQNMFQPQKMEKASELWWSCNPAQELAGACWSWSQVVSSYSRGLSAVVFHVRASSCFCSHSPCSAPPWICSLDGRRSQKDRAHFTYIPLAALFLLYQKRRLWFSASRKSAKSLPLSFSIKEMPHSH